MKKNIKDKWVIISGLILLICVIGAGFGVKMFGPEGTNGDYYVPFDQRTQTFRILQMWPGDPSNDSIIVHNDGNDYVRRIAPLNTFLANYATTSSLSSYMTTSAANTAINNMQNDINGKVPNSRTITINGVTFDLSANRTWTVSSSRTINNNVSRTLNSNYTISTTRDSDVTYSLNLSVTNPLLAGTSTATAFLEYSTDGGTNWTTVSQVANSSSVALTVTVAITLPNTFTLSGYVPANALTRIRTTTSGTASVTYTRGQETLL